MAATETTSAEQNKKLPLYISLVLAFVTLLLYSPIAHHEFVNFDDTDFVTANPEVQSGLTMHAFKWAWHSEVARNWHPITMLTHMLDCQLWGLKPGPHHLVNLFYHIANTLLLFHVLRRMTGALWRSAMVAALFALHPLHVESVAWLAERKDVLSTFFWLLTMWAYARYTTAKGRAAHVNYSLALVFCALGLMSKPMLVTMPFVLLLMDYWPLQRLTFGKIATAKKGQGKAKVEARTKSSGISVGKLMVEKIPFLVMSLALCVITFEIQKQGGAMLIMTQVPLGERIGNALISYVRYISKMFWPVNLAGLYLRSGAWPMWEVALAALFLLGISVAVMMQWRRRPSLTAGWLWYVGTLVPVIGIVQVGMQAMADRFTYVPMIGLFVMLAWGGKELIAHWQLPKFAPMAAAAVSLAACAAVTAHQIPFWKDSEALFTRMISATDHNYMAHYNLGNFYSRQKKPDLAIAQFEMAIQDLPDYADAHNNLGGVLLEQKRYDEAIAHYQAAIRINPEYIHYFNLANALGDAGRLKEAVEQYQQALKLKPDSADAYVNLGMVLQTDKKEAEAITQFERAVQLNPELELARFNLANALSHAGRLDEAIAHYQAAARLNPQRVESFNGMGVCYGMEGKMAEAAAQFQEVIRLNPNDAGAYCNLGNALASQNKFDDAIPQYLTALKLNPKDPQTEFNLGLSLARQGKRAEAEAHYQQALQLNPNYAEAQRALESLKAGAANP